LSTQTWNFQVIDVISTGVTAVNTPWEEYTSVADEHGVQGRFSDRVGQVLGAAFHYQGQGL